MQFEKWTDLDISKGRAAVMDLGPILFSGDNHALKLGVHVYNGTEPVTVTGSVAGSAIIANGQTITPFVTGKDGNAAWVEVPQAALVCQGRIEIFLRVSEDDEIAVSLYATGTVKRTTTGEAVNPGTVIPDIGTAVQECVDATAAATAAADDATAAASHAVRYDAAQTLTDEQKTQARTNIGAASEAEHFPATGKLVAGISTTASANGAVATGVGTTASGRASHAEGQLTTADGQVAHAEGYGTTASGDYSHAEGFGTKASGDHQHVFGKYNVEDANDTYLEIAGNGTGDNARSNARTLDWNGNEALAGDLTVNKGGAEEMEVGSELSSLKSALNASTGNGEIEINLAQAIRCGTSPVNFNDLAGGGDYKHALLDVTPGDKFRLTGGSIGVAARLYCFADDNGVIKGSADANVTVNNLLITAPEGSTKLIINYALLSPNPVTAVYGDWLVNDVRQVVEDSEALATATAVYKADKTPVTVTNNDGYFLKADGSVSAYQTGWWVTDQTDISDFESLIVSARSGYNHLLYGFYDSNDTFISGESSGSEMKTIVEQPVAIPANAKYIRISGVYPDQTPALIGVSNSRLENNANLEKWNGKTWIVIGDSLTEKNNTALIKYYDYVSDDTGIEVDVQAHSGTGYANPGNTDNFLTRAQTVPIDADVYTIFGSFNDYEYSQTHSIPIGTATDTGTTTLCGYFNSTISALISRNPLINIGIVSPCPWVSVNEYNGAGNGFGKQYCDALKAVAERWSIPFLDLYECSGLRPWNANFVAAAYTKDSLMGVHPDETGHKILSTKFKEFLGMLLE